MFQVGDLKGHISVLWEDLSLKVSDGVFEDELSSMSVRVYRGTRAYVEGLPSHLTLLYSVRPM